MNIQRIQTGGVTSNAAGQIQRGAQKQEKARVDAPAPTPADVIDTKPQSTRGVSPRLAAYADRIEGRLSRLIKDDNLSPRQKGALEKAQAHFHEMIQQLDDAYETGNHGRESIGSALRDLVAQLTNQVHHIQSGGQIDVKG